MTRATMKNAPYVSGSIALKQAPAPRLILLDGGETARVATRSYPEPAWTKRESAVRARLGSRQVASLAVFAAIVVALLGFALSSVDASARSWRQEAFASVSTSTVSVSAGDSLWQIAESHPVAGVSTQDVVSFIRAQNNLPSSNIVPGQKLEVPAETNN